MKGITGTFAVVLVVATAVVGAATTVGAQTSRATPPQAQVTFTKDIAPIFQDKCQSCHRNGQIAPMPLTTYQESRPWAKGIRQRVLAQTMPPWFLDKHVGIQQFSNDSSLSDEQIAKIVKWVDEGSPEGDPKDMPPPKVWDDEGPTYTWQLSKTLGRQPDLVLVAPDYTVKTHDQDQWDRPITDVGLTEPRWVMAVEMRLSPKEGHSVYHHVIASLQQDETNAPSAQVKVSLGSSSDGGGGSSMGGILMEYAIGKNYDIYRPGTGKLLMPGARIAWEYHTHGTDHDVTSHPELAIYLYPKGQTPKYRTYLMGFQANNHRTDLSIPPNSLHVEEGFTLLKAAARLENFQPHMHMRGKAMELAAILPDGTSRILSYTGNFNFNWMVNHIYADDAAPVLPKGTIIHVTAWHDNTTANPGNPDPNQWVGYGERSIDDMGHAWVNVTYISDQDYAEWALAHVKKGVGRQEGAEQ